MIPSKTHTTKIRSGVKKFKDRISILLCSNATGTEKLNQLVIGKSAKPRCFANFKTERFYIYESNNKAWMT
jgi:hypothetical protein